MKTCTSNDPFFEKLTPQWERQINIHYSRKHKERSMHGALRDLNRGNRGAWMDAEGASILDGGWDQAGVQGTS